MRLHSFKAYAPPFYRETGAGEDLNIPSGFNRVVAYTGFYNSGTDATSNVQAIEIEASPDGIAMAKFAWDARDQQYSHNTNDGSYVLALRLDRLWGDGLHARHSLKIM